MKGLLTASLTVPRYQCLCNMGSGWLHQICGDLGSPANLLASKPMPYGKFRQTCWLCLTHSAFTGEGSQHTLSAVTCSAGLRLTCSTGCQILFPIHSGCCVLVLQLLPGGPRLGFGTCMAHRRLSAHEGPALGGHLCRSPRCEVLHVSTAHC